MITEYLITLISREQTSRLAYLMNIFMSDLARLGYIIPRGSSVFRDAADRRLTRCHLVMTGRGAFVHAWSRDKRLEDNAFLEDLKESVAAPPQVVELRRGRQYHSCRCPRRDRPSLELWCTPQSDYPPLMCSKGGCIAMYRLPLSDVTCWMLEEWNVMAKGLASIELDIELGSDSPSPQWSRFLQRQTGSRGSDFQKLSARVARRVEKETGRKVNVHKSPFHLMWM